MTLGETPQENILYYMATVKLKYTLMVKLPISLRTILWNGVMEL